MDLTSRAVCEAVRDARGSSYEYETIDLLLERTGESVADCITAVRSAIRAGLVMGSQSCEACRLTVAGEALLTQPDESHARYALLSLNDLKMRRFDQRDDLEAACQALHSRSIDFIAMHWSESADTYVAMEVMG